MSFFWTGLKYCPWRYKLDWVRGWFFAKKGLWGLSGLELTAACEQHRQWMSGIAALYEEEFGEPLW